MIRTIVHMILFPLILLIIIMSMIRGEVILGIMFILLILGSYIGVEKFVFKNNNIG